MPTAAPPPRLEREQSRQRSLGRALTVQPLQICACWLRTAELLPYSSSSSSLPLFPVTPSSPTELSLALPYDRRVGVAVEGVSVLCSERLGNGRKKKKNGLRAAVMSNRRHCCSFLKERKNPAPASPPFSSERESVTSAGTCSQPPTSRQPPPRSHWAACYDY